MVYERQKKQYKVEKSQYKKPAVYMQRKAS